MGVSPSRPAPGSRRYEATRQEVGRAPPATSAPPAPAQLQCFQCHGRMNFSQPNHAAVQAIMCPYCNTINGVDLPTNSSSHRHAAGHAAGPSRAPHDSVQTVLNDDLIQRLQLLQRMQPTELLLMREMLEQMNGHATSAASVGANRAQIDRCTSAWTIDDASRASLSGGCTICLEEFEVGQGMRTLPCLHSFHAHCVESWLEKKRECPNCNFDISKAASAANEI